MADDTFQAPTVRPPERYGDHPQATRSRRVQQVVIAAVVAALLGWWIVIAVGRSTPAVRYDLLGFDGVTDTSVDVRFQVDRVVGMPVTCLLSARNIDGDEVGRVFVDVPPDEPAPIELTKTVRTTNRAVSVEVVTCGKAEVVQGTE
jgi:hypothetical protein